MGGDGQRRSRELLVCLVEPMHVPYRGGMEVPSGSSADRPASRTTADVRRSESGCVTRNEARRLANVAERPALSRTAPWGAQAWRKQPNNPLSRRERARGEGSPPTA